MKKIKRIIIGIIIIIVTIIFLPYILNLLTSDIDPIDDSDLNLQVIPISDKDNAYFDLIKIKDILYEPEGKEKEILDMVDNNVWDQKLAEEIISNNQEAFELFSLAARKPKFQNPILANPENLNSYTELPPAYSWRKIAQFSSIKALYLLKQNKNQESIQEALNSVYIGQKIQESHPSMIEYLIAMLMKEIGLESVQEIVSSSDFSTNELKKYASDMVNFYENEAGFNFINKGEYYVFRSNIDVILNGDYNILKYYTDERNKDISKNLKSNYYFRPNETKNLFADYARRKIENANKFCNNIENIKYQRLDSSPYLKMYLTENAIGKTLFYTMANSKSYLNIKKCNEDSLVSATQTLIAIKAYQNDHGNLPDSLSQLAPDYLESVPLDYFDGNQLRYSKENKILYSVGDDGKDEGGSIGEDWKKMPDPTFNIDF